MKITVLGAGSWGICLAFILVRNGHAVTCWTTKEKLVQIAKEEGVHPRFPEYFLPENLALSTNLNEAVEGADLIVESVTASGLRSVSEKLCALGMPKCPIVITSKGIERNTHKILPDVVVDVFGEGFKEQIGILSGPSYADEVIKELPTSVVATAYAQEVSALIVEAFSNSLFRVYPNSDPLGVAFGGALKNVIAIACGISAGLNYGHSAMASLMTRGLHEIRKLAIANGCKGETINGLAGMGDLFLTCSSRLSRNFRFGELLASDYSKEAALEKIGMVVEGAYTCEAALQISQKQQIPMPITEMVYRIIYENLKPSDTVKLLMQRVVKEEHL